MPSISHSASGKWARQKQSANSANKFIGMETDIVIPIIGPVGSGKSTFINTALENNDLKIGHGVAPCTTKPRAVIVDNRDIPNLIPNLEGYRLVLVDTPGFDNPDKCDGQILEEIITWLEESYPRKMIIAGVLYIHDITIKTFKAADRRIIDEFHKRYSSAIQNTILATTNWGPPEPEDSMNHEKALKDTHWVTTIEKGAVMQRFLRDPVSAWYIINDLLERIVVEKNSSAGKTVIDGIDIRKFFHELRDKTTVQASCTVQ